MHRAVPSLGLPSAPGPNVLLKIQCFLFHFRQYQSKQIVFKDIKNCFSSIQMRQWEGEEDNFDLCRVDSCMWVSV